MSAPTELFLDENDYAIIVRSDGEMEQYFPNSLLEEASANEVQASLMIILLLLSDEAPEASKLREQLLERYGS